MTTGTTRRDITAHRSEYWKWITRHADPTSRDALLTLNDHWHKINAECFDAKMHPPYITLTEPSAPQLYGQCCPVSSWGSRLEIRIRPSLLAGTHPHLRGASPDDRLAFVLDVLLHESVHQYVMEHLPGVNETSYKGHGPKFTEIANRIGAGLGLEPVNVRNRGGQKSAVAGHWPHNVRPPDAYGGNYKPHRAVTASSDQRLIALTGQPSYIGHLDGTGETIEVDFDTTSGDSCLTLRLTAAQLETLDHLVHG